MKPRLLRGLAPGDRARGARKEIGWGRVSLTETGALSPLAPLAPLAAANVEVLHWHGDTFDLPASATRLSAARAQLVALEATSTGLSR